MSSISRRDPSRNFPRGSWYARYRDAGGREHAKRFERKLDAQRWLDEATAATLTGQYVDPRAGRVTFREYADEWLDMQTHRKSTAALYGRHLRLHAFPVLGDMPLATIKPSTVQAWVKGLGMDHPDGRTALAPATAGVVYAVTASIFRAALRDKMIPTTPCDGITLAKVSKTRVAAPTTDQVLILRDTVPHELRAIVVLAAGTGMRQGEVLGLTRDRVRLLGRNPAVTVDRQLVTVDGVSAFGPPKTAASTRTIPLPRVVVDALNEHLAAYNVGPDDLLFTIAGKPITRSKFGYLWRPAAIEAGLNTATGTGMHALRHYYASLLIRAGESVKTVQSRLGHASASETLDTYGHMWPDSDDRTREAVDGALGADSGVAGGLRAEKGR